MVDVVQCSEVVLRKSQSSREITERAQQRTQRGVTKYLVFQWRRQIRVTVGLIEVAMMLPVEASKGDATCLFQTYMARRRRIGITLFPCKL